MAVSLSSCCEDPRGNACEKQGEPRWAQSAHSVARSQLLRLLEDLLCSERPPLYEAAPPTYEDTLNDTPPDYTSTDALAGSKFSKSVLPLSPTFSHVQLDFKLPIPLSPCQPIDIDLKDARNVRMAGAKKKKADKAAQRAKWADDSGDEGSGSKDGGEGEQNGGGDGSGSGGAGGGGDDNGGNDEEDWSFGGGGKKNKKKAKKGKEKDEEEEKEDDNKNQADATAGAGAAGANFWDDLGGLGGGGAAAPIAEDANADDEWATAIPGKKAKKGKKKGVDSVPSPAPVAPATAMDDVELDAPKLDISFGGTDKKGNDYSFGSWGGNWGFTGLGGGEKNDNKIALKEVSPVVESPSPWGATTSKKDKKKKTANTFDFGFNDDPEDDDAPAADKGADRVDNAWDSTSAANKKDKKKTKTTIFGALDDLAPDTADDLVVEDEVGKDDDTWGAWGTNKKDKKKKVGTKEDDPIPPVPPVPAATASSKSANADDIWASLGTDKKKKGKKVDDKASNKSDDPPIAVVPEPEPVAVEDDDDGFGIWGSVGKKDKKKKKTGVEEQVNVQPVELPEIKAKNDPWGLGVTTSKKEKEKKEEKDKKKATNPFSTADNLISPISPMDEAAGADDGWPSWSADPKADKKKSKKVVIADPIPPPPPPAVVAKVAEPEPKEDDWMSSSIWGNNKKDKKTKVKVGEVESKVASDKKPANETELSNILDDDPWGASLGSFGKKDKKSTKKGASDVPPPVPSPPNLGLTPGSSPPFGKKSSTDDIDDLDLDDWSTPATGKAKKKDTKKTDLASTAKDNKTASKVEKPDKKADKTPPKTDDFMSYFDDLPAEEVKAKEEPPAKAVKGFWGGFGASTSTSTKPKTAKELEKEKKEKEKEEREAKAKEEAEQKAQEEKEETERAEKEKAKAEKAEKEKADKASKRKSVLTSSKVEAKTDVKSSKKSKEEEVALPSPVEEKEKPASPEAKKSKGDAWNFWSTSATTATAAATDGKESSRDLKDTKESKKTTGVLSRKEIGNDLSTNQKQAILDTNKTKTGAEGPSKSAATATPAAKSKTTSTSTSTTAEATPPSTSDKKVVGKSTVAEKVKALQSQAQTPAPPTTTSTARALGSDPTKKEASGATATRADPPPLTPLTTAVDPKSKTKSSAPALLGVASVTAAASTVAARKSTKDSTKKKDSKSLAADADADVEPVTPVPGGFPLDDPLDAFGFPTVAPATSTKKSDKVTKKSDKKGKELETDLLNLSPPPPPAAATAAKDEKKKKSPSPEPPKKKASSKTKDAAKPPTPPPELSEPEVKPSKKERTRVVRDQGSSSWGFWGASNDPPPPSADLPKADLSKDRKSSKDMPDMSTAKKDRPSATPLSRSKSERKPRDRDLDKSDRSSSDEVKKAEPRPKTTRGASISSLFGKAPPPARSASKRHSVSAAIGKTSSRRQSVDMYGGLPSPPPEDAVNDKASKFFGLGKSKSTREKPRKVPDPYQIDTDDDLIMVDAPDAPAPRKESSSARKSSKRVKDDEPILIDPFGQSSGPDVVNGPEDLAFVDKPERPRVKRSASSAKKPEGFMSLFGGASKKDRKASVADDDGQRLRRESRRIDRSTKHSDPDRPSADAGHRDKDLDDSEARRAERRARRAEREGRTKDDRNVDTTEAEDRAVRRKEKDRSSKSKPADDRDKDSDYDRKKEERRAARRASKDVGPTAPPPPEDRDVVKEQRRRESKDVKDRAIDDRRRSSYKPYTEDDDYVRRKVRPSTKTRRSSTMSPGEEYLKSRNGTKSADRPALKRSGTDKTASWVKEVNEVGAEPEPIAETVIEPVPDFKNTNGVDKERDRDRDVRKAEPRKSEYRKEREKEKERERRKRDREILDDEEPVSPVDARPVPLNSRDLDTMERQLPVQNKRTSIFGRFF